MRAIRIFVFGLMLVLGANYVKASECSQIINKILYTDNMMGMLKARIQGRSLALDMVWVSDSYRGKGLSKELFYKLLNDNDNITSIRANLMFDNNKLRPYENSTLEECFDALIKSPIYKVIRLYGFRHVVCMPGPDNAFIEAEFIRL